MCHIHTYSVVFQGAVETYLHRPPLAKCAYGALSACLPDCKVI